MTSDLYLKDVVFDFGMSHKNIAVTKQIRREDNAK